MEKKGLKFEYVALIEPTSPLRKKNDIDKAITLLHKNRNNFDSLISVGKISQLPNFLKKIIINNKIVSAFPKLKKISRRQDSQDYFFPYCVVYLAKIKNLLHERTFYCKNSIGMKIDRFQCYEIDDIDDLTCVEALLKKYKKNL
jgi:CMP-N-acetylneuraminic acid synthetase